MRKVIDEKTAKEILARWKMAGYEPPSPLDNPPFSERLARVWSRKLAEDIDRHILDSFLPGSYGGAPAPQNEGSRVIINGHRGFTTAVNFS